MNVYISILASLCVLGSVSSVTFSECEEPILIESGWVCGSRHLAQNGAPYASYRGIPYAKQPVGELRFKELQPVEPWEGLYDARKNGPICYQHIVYFGPLMQPSGYSEACMFVNVHVPGNVNETKDQYPNGLPIMVFAHGGSWICGSGDSDFNGAEFLVEKDVIVITFNYRLNVIGFLSLGTPEIPGNNGLRDGLTVLRWVQRNARYFGGNPDEVTFSGQSSGANLAHLLSLSPSSKGLFKRLWVMSGGAIPNDFTTSPAYAKEIATALLTKLGLNGTDVKTVHRQLIQMPIEQLHNASVALLLEGRLSTFTPVQDSGIPGVTPIIPDDPVVLLSKGHGDDVPVIIGFTDNECASLRPRLEEIDAVGQYEADHSSIVFIHWLYTMPKNVTSLVAEKTAERYFGGDPTMDKYVELCSDTLVVYPAIKYVRDRIARNTRGAAPVYMYKFSYEAVYNVLKLGLNLTYSGSGHMEDLNNILRVNSYIVPFNAEDDKMKNWTSGLVATYAKTGSPSPGMLWPHESTDYLQYQRLATPMEYKNTKVDKRDQDMFEFFESFLSH